MPAREYCRGAWVAQWAYDGDSRPLIGQILDVYGDESSGGVLLDVALYAPDGERIGRISPAEGGPTTFEPACAAARWALIEKPEFGELVKVQWYGSCLRRAAPERIEQP